MHTTRPGPRESWLDVGRRVLRVAWQTGLAREALTPGTVRSARLVAREGVDVRTVHAIHAASRPDRPAWVDDHRSLTWAEADREINRAAHALRDHLGVRRERPVVLMLENRVEYVAAWFACFRLGASSVHASYRGTADELGWQVEQSGARVVVVSAASIDAARALRDDRPDLGLRVVLCGDGEADPATVRWDDLLEGCPTRFPTRPRGAGEATSENVVYTSGTTGRPKGAVRDFARFGLVELTRILDRLPVRAADRHLVVSPLYHSGAQAFTLLYTSLGGTLHLRPHFDAEDTLRTLSREGIHGVFMVPTMIRRVLDLPREVHAACPTPHLRALVSGAAPFPQALRERAIARFGPDAVFDFYGATELGWVTLADGHDMLRRPGTVGRPLAGQEVRVVDEDGRALPPDEVGEIQVRNGQSMSGYLRDEAATDEIRRRGWVTVEDLGSLDEEGYLYVAGRGRDMVISGGVNLYPVEIEEVLHQHPSVDDVAVLGLPDEEWGERLVACVVPAGDRFDPEAVEAWARGRMSGYKLPREWHVVEAVPRNPTGKILKRDLRERLQAGRSGGG